jgi:hypothetical protein
MHAFSHFYVVIKISVLSYLNEMVIEENSLKDEKLPREKYLKIYRLNQQMQSLDSTNFTSIGCFVRELQLICDVPSSCLRKCQIF